MGEITIQAHKQDGYLQCKTCGKEQWIGKYGIHWGDGAGVVPEEAQLNICSDCLTKMKKATKIMTTTQAHKQYTINTGDNVPGVTTVLSILAKPALIKWANNLGLQGIDSTKYKDKMADIGTITHLFILAEFTRKQPDLSEYANADIEQAHQCLEKFKSWKTAHKCEPIIVETPLASDIYGYGGTPDFIGKVNGELELMDFKTSNAIYTDNFLQIAAYRQLAKEQGLQIKQARIIRVGKDPGQGFEDRLITRFDDEFNVFLHCLGIYNLLKQMKRSL